MNPATEKSLRCGIVGALGFGAVRGLWRVLFGGKCCFVRKPVFGTFTRYQGVTVNKRVMSFVIRVMLSEVRN